MAQTNAAISIEMVWYRGRRLGRFDTVRFKSDKHVEGFNCGYENGWIIISIDECTTLDEMADIVQPNDFIPDQKPLLMKPAMKDYKWQHTLLEKNLGYNKSV